MIDLIIGIISGFVIAFIVFFILWLIFSNNSSNRSIKNQVNRQFESKCPMYSGRMDTPPKMVHPKSWEELNPNAYNGRMNTPPKIKLNKSWEELNPKAYHGRMNTPPALPLSDLKRKSNSNPIGLKYCPFCGDKVSPAMQRVIVHRPFVFCAHCGKKIQ